MNDTNLHLNDSLILRTYKSSSFELQKNGTGDSVDLVVPRGRVWPILSQERGKEYIEIIWIDLNDWKVVRRFE